MTNIVKPKEKWMKTFRVSTFVASAFLAISMAATAQDRNTAPAPIVFFDLASSKVEELKAFYADLFGWRSDATGQLTIPVTAPLPSAFRQDPAEKRIYIGVADVAKKLDEIKSRGGTIDVPRFEVRGVAVLALFKDPAGNAMGLVEMQNGKPKIP
jgi:predicted enzyme related to lactoylglutathione lyase